MPSFLGFHGTCMSRANAILSGKFSTKGLGLRGVGAYFWLGEYAKDLSVEWYEHKHSQNEYRGELDPSIAVLRAEIECSDDEYINLATPDLRETLEYGLKELKVKTDRKIVAQTLQRLIQRIIDDYKKSGIDVKIIECTVNGVPGTCYPWQLGFPPCLVVRNDICIQNVRLETL